jgi:lipoprotein signal peptidase
VKLKYVIIIISLIIIVDQVLKVWIKTTYHFGEANEITPWFHLHFIENPGMAWGWKFGNETGKIILTLFRLAAVIFGTWYLGKIVKSQYHKGFIVCAALIYAGALGNLIDSMFYGMIFDKGYVFVPALKIINPILALRPFPQMAILLFCTDVSWICFISPFLKPPSQNGFPSGAASNLSFLAPFLISPMPQYPSGSLRY